MTDVPIKRGHLNTDMHTGRSHVKMKAEIEVMLPQAEGPQRLPASHQKNWERCVVLGDGSPSQAIHFFICEYTNALEQSPLILIEVKSLLMHNNPLC